MSLQVAILKVLVSYPGGRATLADMRRDLNFLTASGKDWADWMKRLAARCPGLDIFGQRLVLRDEVGWTITSAGRDLLEVIQDPSRASLIEAAVAPEPVQDLSQNNLPSDRPRSAITLIGRKIRRPSRGRRGEPGLPLTG